MFFTIVQLHLSLSAGLSTISPLGVRAPTLSVGRRIYEYPKLLKMEASSGYPYNSDGKQQTIELLQWKQPRTR